MYITEHFLSPRVHPPPPQRTYKHYDPSRPMRKLYPYNCIKYNVSDNVFVKIHVVDIYTTRLNLLHA